VVRATRTRWKKGETGRTVRGRTATRRTETGQAEASRTETGQAEASRTETGHAEADRTEAGRTETERTETDRTETDRTETGQAETGRTETGQAEAGQAEAGQAEAGQAETGQAEAGQAEAGQAETGRTETGQVETAQAERDPIETGYVDTGSPRRPRSDSLELGPLAGAVPSARLHARYVLMEWGLGAIAENAELVVSELVTNALQATWHAGTCDPVRLSLLADDRSVLVVVSDAIPDPPRPRRAGPGDEEGRGLTIVGKVSDWWDWKPAHGGKLVRALVAH
jgi:anti-sigma regulatory factor (Ser/Thr protein kinase)